MTLNQSWLDDFLALSATGNFSRAASERHMTQPAFSRRIRALEEWLGQDLFDRSSQPAQLTEVGLWFCKAARQLQSQVASLPGEARAIAQASSATLRFASTHALSFTFLPQWLQVLAAQAPLGPLQLSSDVQQQCERLLLQHQVQFVLTHGHPEVPGPLDLAGCAHLVVGCDTLLPVCAPGPNAQPLHGLPDRGQGQPVALLGYSAESGLQRILQALKGEALQGLALQPVVTAHLASVLRRMALDGRGLAWLPRRLITEDLDQQRLVLAGAADWQVPLEIRLYRDPGPLGPAAEALWAAASTGATG